MDNNQESPRARLQALLKIPERQRTDAEWDEIHELEITLAPGNADRPAQHRMPAAGNTAPPPQGDRGRQQPRKNFQDFKKRRDGSRPPGRGRHGK
jgi:hypothetical protein